MATSSLTVLIVTAVVASFTTGATTALRWLFIDRPAGRQSEIRELRETDRKLREEIDIARAALFAAQREAVEATTAAAVTLRSCEQHCWALQRQLDEALEQLEDLRGGRS